MRIQYHGLQRKVIDHYENPRNVGKMDAEDPDVATGSVRLLGSTLTHLSHRLAKGSPDWLQAA